VGTTEQSLSSQFVVDVQMMAHSLTWQVGIHQFEARKWLFNHFNNGAAKPRLYLHGIKAKLFP
jgi:hypothetical protein